MARGPQTYQSRIELFQGTLDMLLLQTLQRGAMHGHGIAQTKTKPKEWSLGWGF